MTTRDLGLFKGRKLGDGTLAFYPTMPDSSPGEIRVVDYVLPVTPPASDWYFANTHGSRHSGLDINLRRAPRGDVDLGQPVYTTCNGLVVFAGMALGNSWGNLVITLSVEAGQLLFWRYAHLQDVFIDVGQVLPAGALLGTIGKGKNDRYAAHLHLDAWRGYMLAPESWLSRRVDWVDPLQVWADAGYVWEWGSS